MIRADVGADDLIVFPKDLTTIIHYLKYNKPIKTCQNLSEVKEFVLKNKKEVYLITLLKYTYRNKLNDLLTEKIIEAPFASEPVMKWDKRRKPSSSKKIFVYKFSAKDLRYK